MNPASPLPSPPAQNSYDPRKYRLVSSGDLPDASDVGATRKA
jgi:hypothetical protein